MKHKHDGRFVVSPDRITVIEDKLEKLFKRIENIEKQIKEDKEEQLKKLKAELDYAKFRCALPIITDMAGRSDEESVAHCKRERV